jgi:branched-chain amino acid aminotransferase
MPADQARVSVFDSGFMQGVGLFETMRAYAGRVFRLQRHTDRLIASARTLGWTVIPDADSLADNVRQVISATGHDARVRLTVTTGSLHAAAGDVPALTVVASASDADKYPDELYQRGVTVITSPHRQHPSDPTAGHKTTSYFARLAALRAAHLQGAFEALWLTPDENVAEASMANVFIVKDEQLLTPPADTPVVPGIARAAVMELAVEQDIPTRERVLTLEDVLNAEEVFLTSSMIEVLPVVRLGRQPVGNEKVGHVTRQLAVAFGELIDREDGE